MPVKVSIMPNVAMNRPCIPFPSAPAHREISTATAKLIKAVSTFVRNVVAILLNIRLSLFYFSLIVSLYMFRNCCPIDS